MKSPFYSAAARFFFRNPLLIFQTALLEYFCKIRVLNHMLKTLWGMLKKSEKLSNAGEPPKLRFQPELLNCERIFHVYRSRMFLMMSSTVALTFGSREIPFSTC